ncbi:hypothetical protein [Pectobacterium brasiliense]|uniref:hypothetical protein n=1 Tax=Pectobacterium brasiliense TaxID=180957 RepID=UPI00196944F3|nr:hypothetical protein [Pectobacterium brasiliense]MBN3264727.1 hypothetical protein [Pectobacterium brasiliense]
MICKIYCKPSLTVSHVKSDNNACLEKKSLKNGITGSTINVSNVDVDFRILSKEFSLFREVKNNPCLAEFANIQAQKKQSDRLWSVGMAVTAICNMIADGKAKEKADEICDKNPRNNSSDIKNDLSINRRGQQYIHSFLNAETPLDSTHYATGLMIGSDMREYIYDPVMCKQFDVTWKLRIALSGK